MICILNRFRIGNADPDPGARKLASVADQDVIRIPDPNFFIIPDQKFKLSNRYFLNSAHALKVLQFFSLVDEKIELIVLSCSFEITYKFLKFLPVTRFHHRKGNSEEGFSKHFQN